MTKKLGLDSVTFFVNSGRGPLIARLAKTDLNILDVVCGNFEMKGRLTLILFFPHD